MMAAEITLPSPKEVPVISIQCDWNETLRNLKGEAWVSCKFRGQPSFHGKICNTSISNGVPTVSTTDGFGVDRISRNTVHVKHIPSDNLCIFVAPNHVFSSVHCKSILSLSVTPQNLGISSSTDDKLHIWDSSTGIVRRSLGGHVGNVYKCRFFPSGVVVLSGGADMQIKIWSAETGQCPVTFSGHTAAVTDFCVVDRGRNIISVSKDGSAKLWDCGTTNCLATLAKLDSAINSSSLATANKKLHIGEPEEAPSDREIGTKDKVLILGCENGTVHVISVWSRKKLFSLQFSSAINCVVAISDEHCVAGCQDGQIILIKIEETPTVLCRWFESNSAVLCLLCVKEDGFFVGKADGSCTYYKLSETQSNGRVQLTGPDCDPVYDIAFDGTCVYTACRDAVVRKYDVLKVIQNV